MTAYTMYLPDLSKIESGPDCRPDSFSSPEPTIILTCGRDRELCLDPIFWARQSIRFIFSANQICQTWREVRESPELDKARALDPCRRSEWSWALGTRVGQSGPDYIIAAHAFVKATLRLGLRAPLVARKNLLTAQQLFVATSLLRREVATMPSKV